MPIYEYRCAKCGDFEVTQKIMDKPLTKCLTCKSKVTKLISNTSFQLKGSGWYITDYARAGSSGDKNGDKSKDGAGDTSAATSDGESKSESPSSTTEAKSESKPPPKAKSEPKSGSTKSKTKQSAAA